MHTLPLRLGCFSSLLCLLLFGLPLSAQAHGTMETPISRVLNCFAEGPEKPLSEACQAAVEAGGKQALYDWNAINQASANGNHRAVVPDGKLCSGGKPLFKGLDLPRDDWRSTAIAPDANGNFKFVYHATAPHATRNQEFYITRDGYNPNLPLKWADLESAPFCTISSVTLDNGRYHMNCPLPKGKTGKHVIYNTWQRSDSQEAFYACIDVSFSGAVASPWQALGNVRAMQDLPAGSKVILRLFDAQGQDAQRHSLTLSASNSSANAWPKALAKQVNAASTLVNIGVLDASGAVKPVASSQDNQVYVRSPESYKFQIDIDLFEKGSDSGDSGEVDYVYPQGIEQYQAGTKVRGKNDLRYQCKPLPEGGWCKIKSPLYEPGEGSAWTDAWDKLD